MKLAKSCTACARLVKSRRRIVWGQWANSDHMDSPCIVLIGEAPGETEDRTGTPFAPNAMTGRELRHILWREGLAKYVYITNVVKCHPKDNDDPTAEELENCSQYLWQEVIALKPALVISAGRYSSRWALHRHDFTMEMVSGILYHSPVLECPVLPVAHPAAGFHDQRSMVYVMEGFKRAGEYWKEIRRGG